MLTAERVRDVLNYDAETGIFTWRISRPKARAGCVAGCLDRGGYRLIMVDGKLYKAHRLAWFYSYGVWPEDDIDHVNGDAGDNRLSNLREATRSQNNCNTGKQRNNSSGRKGVYLHRAAGKWAAEIRFNRKREFLGLFYTVEAAAAAYEAAAKRLHGEFANVGGSQR